jgi:xanthine dehydrogenase accessory factor
MHAAEFARVIARARSLSTSGKGAVIATLVAAGSTGLEIPSRLIVLSDGETEGALGAQLEETVVRAAMQALSERRSRLSSFALQDGSWLEVRPQSGDVDVFLEVLAPPVKLVIVGAGHIAVPLAKLGSLLGFLVTVLDDREEYASRERFPTAQQILVGPYRDTLATVPLDQDSYVVLVTRGHVHDQACLELVLDRSVAYIGMIGSRRRVRTVMKHLSCAGVDPARLHSVHAPVGLDIGAQTPEEIALAIMAEVVNVRRGGRAPSLALGERLRV